MSAYRVVGITERDEAELEAELTDEIRHTWRETRPRNWDNPPRMYADVYADSSAAIRAELIRALLSEAGQSRLHWDSLACIFSTLLRRRQYIPAPLAEWAADVFDNLLERNAAGRPRTGQRHKTWDA